MHLMTEQGPPDDALVVRGGLMSSTSLESNAYGSHADPECGLWAISVWSFEGLSPVEIVREARKYEPRALPQGKLRVSTAGRIRSADYGLVATNLPGHYSLVVSPEPDEAIWEDLREIFDEPIPNPERL